jgi:energy-coupling factor transporter ATP-binding protein EcfA2
MAIQINNTKHLTSTGVKVLVYGASGAGKTTLVSTAPAPIVLSAEAGLLSLRDYEIPYIEIRNMDDLAEAYSWAAESEEASGYQTICLDSISEIAEVVLTAEKKKNKDPRAAYGVMQDTIQDYVRKFRDLFGKHVYFSAKLEKVQDEMGRIMYGPSMPGNKTGQLLPYYFDEVLALRVEHNENNETIRMLQCESDGTWLAKDRSGKLDKWMEPDLSGIMQRILA